MTIKRPADVMKRVARVGLSVLLVFSIPGVGVVAQQRTQIRREDRELAERMLQNLHDALKRNYYDPSFHGIDIDARYRQYGERLRKAETLGGALRVLAAYLSGLNDSHTIFLPPNRNNIADYGFEMQMVGDACYVTEVRPGSDAEQKIHPGDQILSLDGYAVERADLTQLRYYLRGIAPKSLTGMIVRSPSGETRNVLVATKFVNRRETWNEETELQTRHLLRQRYVERGDVLFWKMPTFFAQGNEIDRVIDIARQHKALVLDLRRNAGGSIALMERLIGSVMDQEVTIGMRVMRGGKKPEIAKPEGRSCSPGNWLCWWTAALPQPAKCSRGWCSWSIGERSSAIAARAV